MIDRDAIRRMNAEGMNDVQIAKVLGCRSWIVSFRRREMGIPTVGEAEMAEKIDRIRKLAAEGCSDKEMAKEFGCTWTNIRHIRYKNRIPCQARRRICDQRAERENQIAKLVAEGMTDAQIAERIGLSTSRTAYLRRGLGLPFNHSEKKPENLRRVAVPVAPPKLKPHPMLAEIAARKSRLVAEGFTEQQALRAVAHQMGVQI